MQQEQLQRIIGYFTEEARDHLGTIEQGLLNLQSTIEEPERINQVFRSAHSVKGGAAMLGFSSIQRTARCIENCFQLFKEYPLQLDGKLVTLLLRVFHALKELVELLARHFSLDEDMVNQIMLGVEPVFAELSNHLELLVREAEQINANLRIRATNESERLYLSGKCTLQAIAQAVNLVGATIIRRNWEKDSAEQLNLEMEMRLPEFSSLDELTTAIQSAGGIIETIEIEVLKTCRQCHYYYGQCDVICAIHPLGPEEEHCRDWEPRKERMAAREREF